MRSTPTTRFALAAAILFFCLLGGAATSAEAGETGANVSPLRFSAYGTLSRSWDDRDDLSAIRDFTQRPDNGHRAGPSWLLDSRLGAQFGYRFGPRLDGVVQIVARDQIDNNFDAALELAHLAYQPHANYTLRFGRIGYDTFLMSDHRNLGYAYPWVRPPREFYSWLPMFSLDGLDLTYALPTDAALWRLRAQAGVSQYLIPMGNENFDFETAPVYSLTLQREAGPWRIKAGLSHLRSTNESGPLVAFHAGLEAIAAAGIPGISAEAAHLRKETSFRNLDVDYVTLGAAYDDGTWIGQTEIARSRTSTSIATAGLIGYAAIGRRFGTLTPYAILSASRPGKERLKPVSNWGLIGQAGLQTTAYHIVNSTRQDQETFSLGVRWDFDTRAAMKLQWDHSRIHSHGYALWFRDMAANTRNSRANLLTLSVDFVF